MKETILGKAALRERWSLTEWSLIGDSVVLKEQTEMRHTATVCIPQWGDADASHLVRTQS